MQYIAEYVKTIEFQTHFRAARNPDTTIKVDYSSSVGTNIKFDNRPAWCIHCKTRD